MGGNAFAELLPSSPFPRMPRSIYDPLKVLLHARLQPLYQAVGTPTEAPGKVDYGDVDFLVCSPNASMSHEAVVDALGATHSIAREGPRTSHFAIPSAQASSDEDESISFYQVDVHLCEDLDEWERIMFYHSFGDLGMILGTICHTFGLSFGTKGLRVCV